MKKIKKYLLTLLLAVCICCYSDASSFFPVLYQSEDFTNSDLLSRP